MADENQERREAVWKLIKEIEDRYSHYSEKLKPGTAVADIRILLAEIKKCREDRDTAQANYEYMVDLYERHPGN